MYVSRSGRYNGCMQYRYLLFPIWTSPSYELDDVSLSSEGPTFRFVGEWKDSIDEALQSIPPNLGGGKNYLVHSAWVETQDGCRYVQPLHYVSKDFFECF
jgi:hypothetical protein